MLGGVALALAAASPARASCTWSGAASAAGRHVAWIEERVAPGRREVVVRVVSVSRRARVRRSKPGGFGWYDIVSRACPREAAAGGRAETQDSDAVVWAHDGVRRSASPVG